MNKFRFYNGKDVNEKIWAKINMDGKKVWARIQKNNKQEIEWTGENYTIHFLGWGIIFVTFSSISKEDRQILLSLLKITVETKK